MGRDRQSLSALALRGSNNIGKAMKLREEKPNVLARREELEKIFDDTLEMYTRAVANLKERGEVITVTKFSGKSSYEVETTNPYLRIAQTSASRLANLAKLLSRFEGVKPDSPSAEPLPGTAGATVPEVFEQLRAEGFTC